MSRIHETILELIEDVAPLAIVGRLAVCAYHSLASLRLVRRQALQEIFMNDAIAEWRLAFVESYVVRALRESLSFEDLVLLVAARGTSCVIENGEPLVDLGSFASDVDLESFSRYSKI